MARTIRPHGQEEVNSGLGWLERSGLERSTTEVRNPRYKLFTIWIKESDYGDFQLERSGLMVKQEVDLGLGWPERSGLVLRAVELSADASAGATLRVSNHKRAILVSGEITKVRDVLRALDGGKYIPSLKGWCYPGKMCRQILAVLRADPSNTVVDETQSG
ncbi:hypothetical protein T492DRAFT_846853 [Pavlovales sp. CCMP2436]|nr:hypothetical protein T492DRAFT_846853 [Pavlovales sp. CCMP2436]